MWHLPEKCVEYVLFALHIVALTKPCGIRICEVRKLKNDFYQKSFFCLLILCYLCTFLNSEDYRILRTNDS